MTLQLPALGTLALLPIWGARSTSWSYFFCFQHSPFFLSSAPSSAPCKSQILPDPLSCLSLKRVLWCQMLF